MENCSLGIVKFQFLLLLTAESQLQMDINFTEGTGETLFTFNINEYKYICSALYVYTKWFINSKMHKNRIVFFCNFPHENQSTKVI